MNKKEFATPEPFFKTVKKKVRPKLEYIPNAKAASVAKSLKKGSRIIGLTKGQFSLIDLIYEILKHQGKSEVIVVTWSAGIKDVRTVDWMKKTDLLKSFLLITDHSYVSRKQDYILDILNLFGEDNIRTSEIHAKFTLIGNENFRTCIRTSMNLNANKTCESFEIDESPEIYNFYEDFVKETFNQMPKGFTPESSVVNRAVTRTFNKLRDPFKWQEK